MTRMKSKETGSAKGRVGSLFDDYLDEEGIREEVEDAALKEIAADQIAKCL